jgi:hypothetical protein
MMKRNIRTKKRGPVRAKKVVHDGITFASGLERYMYSALKEAGIKAHYEGETYTLVDGFSFNCSSFERQGNGKGEMVDRGHKRVLGIKYTPDFIGEDFIIECKGRANETFPMRWKMFKKYVENHMPYVTLYKPQNQKECDLVIEKILEK